MEKKVNEFLLRKENQWFAPLVEARVKHAVQQLDLNLPPSDSLRPIPTKEEMKVQYRTFLSSQLLNMQEREQIVQGFDLVIEYLPRISGGERVKQEIMEIGKQLMDVYEQLAGQPHLGQILKDPTEVLDHTDPDHQTQEATKEFMRHAEELQQQMGITPLFVSSISEVGCLLFSYHEFGKALAVFQLLSLLAPMSHQGWFSAALCSHRLKRYPEAIANYSMAILTDAWNFQTYINLALCYQAVHDQENLQEVLHIAEKMVQCSSMPEQDKKAWNQVLVQLKKE